MTSRLVVRPQAEEELLGARDWYDGQRAGLGQEFVDDVREALDAVSTRPLTFPKVAGETRRAILRRFPYGLFFQATSNEVVVLAIIHGRRHPQRWKSRR